MKTIISPLFGLALLSGIAVAAPEYTMFKPYKDRPVTYYRRPLPPTCRAPEPEMREITRTEQALRMRRNAIRRAAAISAVEAEIWTASTPRITGRVSAQPLPLPLLPPPPPMMMPPQGELPPPPPDSPGALGSPTGMILPPAGPPMMPLPVADVAGTPPRAKPVKGRPGFVVSPYNPATGYIDVTGIPSGTETRDPYSGKIFLVP